MRGKLVVLSYRDRVNGITPAGAGKTVSNSPLSVSEPDHPRRCGENFSATGLLRKVWGSPPQVRGKRMIDAEKDGYLGITPAGAGKTLKALATKGCI